jgi:hypothetical protein
VIEEDVPEKHLLDEIECGFTAKTHDFDDMAAKIEKALATKYEREAIMTHFLTHHTYEQRVIEFDQRFACS